MNTEDLTRELERTKLALSDALTALEDIEEVCADESSLKADSSDAASFPRAEAAYRLTLIKRRLARHRAGQ